MLIKYKIKLKNPVSSILQPTSVSENFGSFEVTKGLKGIKVKGSLKDYSGNTTSAYNYSFPGESFYLQQNETINLKEEVRKPVDVEDVFKALGKSVESSEYLKIVSNVEKARYNGVDYFLQYFIEKATDVIVFKIDKKGIVKKVTSVLTPFSNLIKIDKKTLEEGDTVMYTIVSKTLKIDTDDVLFLTEEDLVKIPEGFVTIKNKVFSKELSDFDSFSNYYTLTSFTETSLRFTTNILIDGVKSSRYILKPNEKVVMEVYEGLSPFSKGNLIDNLTFVYELTTEGDQKPILIINGLKDLQEDSEGDKELFDKLKKADKEFLKKYSIKEYKIKLTTKDKIYTLFDKKLIEDFRLNDGYKGITVNYE